MPHLREILDTMIAAGARYWQVQLTVAMGNAVDNARCCCSRTSCPS